MTAPSNQVTFAALVAESGQLLGSLEHTLRELAEFTVQLREQVDAQGKADDVPS